MAQRKLFVGPIKRGSAMSNQSSGTKVAPISLASTVDKLGRQHINVTNLTTGQARTAFVDGNPAKWIVNHPEVHKKVYDMLPPQAKVAVDAARTVNNLLPESIRVTPEKISGAFKGVPVGEIVIRTKSGNSNPMNASYGLSKAPMPKKVSLNSGIVPNAYANDYMYPVEGMCSPMHMNNVTLQIPTNTSNVLYSYFINTLAFDIQTRAQSNVGFSLDISSTFSAATLLSAFNAAIRGLQVYYFYSSILSYESDPRNKNAAMIALRQNITPQLISDLTQLGRRLEDTPIPPRIVEWVRYMNMTFLSGESQGAPLLKFGYNVYSESSPQSPTDPASALTNLVSYNSTYALIRRAIPQWRVGVLYDVPVTPVYDRNFLTIFANSPCRYYSSTSTNERCPAVASTSTTINYNSYNNRLDGAAYACTSAYSSSMWSPGLITPDETSFASVGSSRKSYYSVSGTVSWYDPKDYSFLTSSRLESYVSTTGLSSTALTPHLSGAEKCKGVSIDSLNQTAQNFLDFLFNVNSIPAKGKLSNFNNRNTNQV